MLIHGWGGYPRVEAEVIEPATPAACLDALGGGPFAPRGMGRSYGDSASASRVLQTRHLDHFIAFDAEAGLLSCEAGVTLHQILRLIVPKGWFLPVTPGTGFVTLGGAIASDVHGKNHHRAGSFGDHVRAIRMMLGNGEIITASPEEHADLFHATCGGMGLTGLILSAQIALIPVRSAAIRQTIVKTRNIEEACARFEAHGDATYSVAWIDCIASGASLGRSVISLGEHAGAGELRFEPRAKFAMPCHAPAGLLNRWSIGAFNRLYYAKARDGQTGIVPAFSYFYPLDAIGAWNRLYGRPGFVQFQFVLPRAGGVGPMRPILARIAASGSGSFLAVLKMFGPGNANPLSFPVEGYTLALDFKMCEATVRLLRDLEAMVIEHGGRIYLTKDALMSEQSFKAGYPRWHEFETVRERYGAIGHFASAQSRRLGLQ